MDIFKKYIQGPSKKTTHWHFSSHVRNFQRISHRTVLNRGQINYRSYAEKIIKIDSLVSKIFTVEVRRRIFELNRLKYRLGQKNRTVATVATIFVRFQIGLKFWKCHNFLSISVHFVCTY